MNYSLIFFLGGGITIFILIMFYYLIKKNPKILILSLIILIILLIYLVYSLGLQYFPQVSDLLLDLISCLSIYFSILFADDKETIEGSGSDPPDTGRGNSSGGASTGPSAGPSRGSGRSFWEVIEGSGSDPPDTGRGNSSGGASTGPSAGASAGASAGPSAGPSRVQGRSFWEVIDASQEGGTSNSPVEDENPSLPEEGPSTLDKGKRKATEQEVLEQEERKRTRVSSPSPANEVYLKQEGSNRIKGSEESEEVNMEDIPELKENQDSPGSIYSIYSSNINTDDEEWVKEKKRERDASEEFLPRTRDEWDRARDRALNEEEEPNN